MSRVFASIADLPFNVILDATTPDVWAALALSNHRFIRYVHAYYDKHIHLVNERRRGDFWRCIDFYSGRTGGIGCHEATICSALTSGYVGYAKLLSKNFTGNFLNSQWCQLGSTKALDAGFYDCARMFPDGTFGEPSVCSLASFFSSVCLGNHLEFAKWMYVETEGKCAFKELRADCGDMAFSVLCRTDESLPMLHWLEETNQIGVSGIGRVAARALYTAAKNDAIGVLDFLTNLLASKQSLRLDTVVGYIRQLVDRPLVRAWIASRRAMEL